MRPSRIVLLCSCLVLATLDDTLEVGDTKLSEEGSLDGYAPSRGHHHMTEATAERKSTSDDANMCYDATITSDSYVSDTDIESEVLTDTSSFDDDCMHDDHRCDDYVNDDHVLDDADTSDTSDADRNGGFQPFFLK